MKKDAILFGASSLGEGAFHILKSQFNFIFYCDNDSKKWGNKLNKLIIEPPEKISQHKDAVIIISSMYDEEIEKQLIGMGIYNFLFFSFKLDINTPKLISDMDTIKKFIEQEDFPFLVSFPRTGSHWLRMIMELYLSRPTLTRALFFSKSNDFTCFHTHDMDLTVRRKNVIYLYRQPTEVIFSQMMYHRQDLNDNHKIKEWSELYGKHLNKWLLEENCSTKKTLISYEGLKDNINEEFLKVCEHLNVSFDPIRLSSIQKNVSKHLLKEKTGSYDNQVVNINSDYSEKRDKFITKYNDFIKDIILSVNDNLDIFLKK